MGRGTPTPQTPPPRRLRRLDTRAFGARLVPSPFQNPGSAPGRCITIYIILIDFFSPPEISMTQRAYCVIFPRMDAPREGAKRDADGIDGETPNVSKGLGMMK